MRAELVWELRMASGAYGDNGWRLTHPNLASFRNLREGGSKLEERESGLCGVHWELNFITTAGGLKSFWQFSSDSVLDPQSCPSS